jgi:hypothetical protein
VGLRDFVAVAVAMMVVMVVPIPVAVAVAMMVVMVVPIPVVVGMRMRMAVAAGVDSCYSEVFFESLGAAGMEAAGRGEVCGLGTGVRKELDYSLEILFCAFGRAGDGYDERAVADSGYGAGHHGEGGYLEGGGYHGVSITISRSLMKS